MLQVSRSVSSAGADGGLGTPREALPPPGSGILSRLAHRRLTPAPDTRVYNDASGQRLAGAQSPVPSTPGASARPEPRPGRRCARFVLFLPAFALLLGALGLFAAAPDALADHTFSAPSNFRTSVGDRSITVRWDPVPNALNYLLQRKKKGESSVRSTTLPQTNITFGPGTVWPLTVGGTETTRNGATYQFRIRALGHAGHSFSPYSPWIEATPPHTLSVDTSHPTPACGTWVNDFSVRPEMGLRLVPALDAKTETQVRILASRTARSVGWRTSLPIQTYGHSNFVPPSITFAELRKSFPGFRGFEYRLKDKPSFTAQCTWDFDERTVKLRATPNPRPGSFMITVGEGKTFTIVVELDRPLTRAVLIPITLTSGTAEFDDIRRDPPIPKVLEIEAGELSTSFLIRTRQDADTDDETLTVALDTAGLPPGLQPHGTQVSMQITIEDDDGSGQQVRGASGGAYAALIAQMYQWREDPQWRHRKSHTDRWDRALLAFGEAVADSTLTAMTAAEAQALADSGLTRWVEVAEALWEIESGLGRIPAPPVVTIAAGEAVTEGTEAGFTLTAEPAPAADLDVTVTVGQEGAFLHSSTLGAHTVTIPAGGTSATLELLTVDDAADEPDGSVSATLGTGTGYTVGDAASASVAVADDDGAQPQVVGAGGGPYAALIAQMYEWRNDPQWRHRRSHTSRWDRALLAFGEPVADSSLTAMTAAEAQALADGGLTRWVGVAKALWQIAGGRPAPVPAIDTKRGIAREGADDAAVFTVRLDRAASQTVSVDYATADGAGSWASTAPARAGADYTATSGTLTFAAGETSKSVSVPILDDAIDEGTEYFLLRFSNPQGATLAAGERETQGLIRNSDPLQGMWLARFGRMVASDAVASVTARLETPRDAGSHVTFAGQRVNFGEAEGSKALATVLTGLAQTFGARRAPAKDDPGSGAGAGPFARHGLAGAWNDRTAFAPARQPTGRELLLGTSFRMVLDRSAGAQWTGWGQGASVSRFSAAGTGLGLSGETATGSMGMDYERGRLLLGFAMTHSVGEGTARDAGWRYALGSTATMALPYARLRLTDRVSVWGLAGAGTGRLSLDLDGAVPQKYRTDLSMSLVAMGGRGDLLTPAEAGGFALALKADAFWVGTKSDRVKASAFGSLAGARGESSRVRAVLDGSRRFAFASGAALTPSLELGVRHDAGDAETGTGLEVGAGLNYADPSRGLDMALKVHGLAVHAERGYDEWGVSGQLRLVPGGAGRGLSMSLTPSWGADPSGSQRLWALPASAGLAANPGSGSGAGSGADPSSRFDAEVGYGLALFGDRFTGTPHVGFGLSGDGAREYRMGWRLTSAVRGRPRLRGQSRRDPARGGQ